MNHESITQAIASTDFNISSGGLHAIVGEDVNDEIVAINFDDFSHLVVAGTSGTGKSTLLHAIALSLIHNYSSEDVKFVLCDTSGIELAAYEKTPYALMEMASDDFHIAASLKWLSEEIECRCDVLCNTNTHSIDEFNSYAPTTHGEEPLTRLVAFVEDIRFVLKHEAARKYVRYILRLGAAVGVHLIAVTQQPSDAAVSSNLFWGPPACATFSINSPRERKLLLNNKKYDGDLPFGSMLLTSPSSSAPQLVMCYPVTDEDIEYMLASVDRVEPQPLAIVYDNAKDPVVQNPLFASAVEILLAENNTNPKQLQQKLGITLSEAVDLINHMEDFGIVGEFNGSDPRPLLITKRQWDKMYSLNPKASIKRSVISTEEIISDVHTPKSITRPQEKEPLFDTAASVVRTEPTPIIAQPSPPEIPEESLEGCPQVKNTSRISRWFKSFLNQQSHN